MAYKINRKDEHVVMPDGMATIRDVQKFVMQKGTPEFYELEPAEVIKVFLDGDDFPSSLVDKNKVPDYSYYGAIEARMVMSSANDSDIKIIKPLDTNIKEYPMSGEYVIVVNYFDETYYTQKLNIHNSVNLNSFPGLSKIWNPFTSEDLKPTDFGGNINIRQLKAYDGDITFNGRFGQSIRFGSNITEKEDDKDSGKEDSPNVIIKAGQGITPNVVNQPVEEDINLDKSSIWMTTNQTVDITKSSTEPHGKTLPEKYDGNQIIVNSDRIVFNSKVNSIHAFSKIDISMAADSRINIESPIVNLGSRVARQPAICGDAMMEQFRFLCGHLITFSRRLRTLLPLMGNTAFPIHMEQIKEAGRQLESSLTSLSSPENLDFPKSKVVYVEKVNGR